MKKTQKKLKSQNQWKNQQYLNRLKNHKLIPLKILFAKRKSRNWKGEHLLHIFQTSKIKKICKMSETAQILREKETQNWCSEQKSCVHPQVQNLRPQTTKDIGIKLLSKHLSFPERLIDSTKARKRNTTSNKVVKDS